ncbi:phage minor head protein [Thalassobaculum sp. OXR-137]|uniref:phage head morphogenesis protein n=1 Tax=Thalassobaculum sp. OXR-137 TaxID=3100173 RepID=UPI002AC95D3A|nr:phage minor head protein [Thalassobaculum sp. OXR-137]WPZ33217.1 phage minor head protein [Thalassobaculum sp. OXR-137]WPZ34890.1 phage minor head protein [Thalassobaculum sp. OXR-137]
MPALELKPLPPREAVDYFRSKGFKVGFAWQDVWQSEHARYFTVAKAMQLDILEDIRGAVDQALADGTTFAQFREGLEPLLQAKGWWGRQRVTDPVTGEERLAQLGSPRRLKTIFDVNLRTSYAAGRWEQIQRTKRLRPYLRYVAVDDDRTRPEHQAWHGTVLPVDDAWWSTHYPPNGWNCRCTVRQLSAREAERLGGVSEAPVLRERRWENQRTGEIQNVPAGIDPGWNYHVGLAADAVRRDATLEQGLSSGATRALLDKLAGARPDIAHAALRDVVRSPDFARQLTKPTVPMPVMRLPPAVAEEIGARSPIAVLSPESLTKNLRQHPDLTPAQYRQLPELGAAPSLIVQDRDVSVVIVRRQDGPLMAAVKATDTGAATYVTSFRRTNSADIRRLIQRGRILFGSWEE